MIKIEPDEFKAAKEAAVQYGKSVNPYLIRAILKAAAKVRAERDKNN